MSSAWLVLLGIHFAGLVYLSYWWHQMPQAEKTQAATEKSPFLSIVIVGRNEAENLPNILQDLASQTYPSDLFELWYMDDASEDASWELLNQAIKKVPFKLHAVRVKQQAGLLGKKAGISQAVAKVSGDYVIATDADCRLPAGWLSGWGNALATNKLKFAFGGVVLAPVYSFFEQLQQTEFASLLGSGAAFLAAAKPGMCNAANMAFCPATFKRVGGYAATPAYPGGDDEFLLQKIWQLENKKAAFVKDKELVVTTRPLSSFAAFQHQRRRWAGKWNLHKSLRLRLTAIGLFVLQLGLLLVGLGLLLQAGGWRLFFGGLLLKSALEFLFLRTVLRFCGQRISLPSVLVWQFLYPVYAIWFGVQANRGHFIWKGRKYSLGRL